MDQFVTPMTVEEALGYMSAGGYQILAGGTDIYPLYVGKPMTLPMMDITGIDSMKAISCDGDHWRIGGVVTWRNLIDADLPQAFNGLKLAACEVGAKQIQNVATIAGNLCNASPAADGVPPLLTLDAVVELTSEAGVRQLALSDFILGNRRTEIQSGELLTAVLIPADNDQARSHFLKLGARSYLVISIAMVAVLVDVDASGYIQKIRISVGACSAVAKRLAVLENALLGEKITEISNVINDTHFANLNPIDDIRATASYRVKAAKELVMRALTLCGGEGS